MDAWIDGLFDNRIGSKFLQGGVWETVIDIGSIQDGYRWIDGWIDGWID
jgi:hypothetical protein